MVLLLPGPFRRLQWLEKMLHIPERGAHPMRRGVEAAAKLGREAWLRR